MCNLYSLTTSQAAITALFRVVSRLRRDHETGHLEHKMTSVSE
jgi:hypothetical protein